MLRAATTAGLLPAALNSLRLHTTQATDVGLDREIQTTLQRISSEVMSRARTVSERAREQGLDYEQRNQIMREFYRAVGEGILDGLGDV